MNSAGDDIVRPTALQEALLRVILLDDAAAGRAWMACADQIEVERLEPGARRLLPSAYARLASWDRGARAGGAVSPATAAQLETLRGEYVRTWQANQLRLHELRDVVDRLQAAVIPVMLLKGAALVLAAYADAGLRPMADCDLLVPYDEAPRAIALLEAAGWTASGAAPHAQSLTQASGFDLDLHWNVLPHLAGAAADRALWDAAAGIALEDIRSRVLCPADQLLHVCVHGIAPGPTSAVRWVVDAATVIRQGAVDWPRLVAQCGRCGVSLDVARALRYLATLDAGLVPGEVVRQLDTLTVTAAERRRHARTVTAPQHRPALSEGALLLSHYLRWSRARGFLPTPQGLVRYVAGASRAGTVRRLPSYVLSRLVGR